MSKKIYSLILFAAVALNASAQINYEFTKPVSKNNLISKSSTFITGGKDFENPLWESDFSEPSDWTIDNNAGNDDDWVIGTEGSSGPFTIGTINSTSAENGFALFDSDLLCSGLQDAWIRNTVPIDLSSSSAVSIQFETYYRDFQGSCFLETSVDGDVWTSTEILDLEVNASTENPAVLTFTLPGLDNAEQGYVRFRYNGGCDYAWMIDDVKIAATPPFDLRMTGGWYDEYILIGSQEEFETIDYLDNLEYSAYSEGNVRPLTFVAEVENTGTENLTGILLSVDVQTPSGMESFTSDALASLSPGELAVLTIDDVLLDAFQAGGELGAYTVSFSAVPNEADEDLTNNGVPSKTFVVTDDYMGNDSGDSYETFNQNSDDCIFGNQFTYQEETAVNYISFGLLGSATVDGIGDIETLVGEELWLNIRQGSVLDDEGPENEMLRLFEEDEITYTIQEDDISSAGNQIWINVMLPDDVMLSPATIYQAEVQLPPVGEPFALITISEPQEDVAGTLYDFNDLSGGPQGWYILGQTSPCIRMGNNGPTGVSVPEALNFTMGQNYPNPLSESTRISWELYENADNVQFSMVDISGKIVYQKDLGSRPSGKQEDIEINYVNLSPGIYQYGLLIDGQRLVRKMIITE